MSSTDNASASQYPPPGNFAPPSGPPPGFTPPSGPPPGQFAPPSGPPPGQFAPPSGPPPGQFAPPSGPPPGQYAPPPGPPPSHGYQPQYAPPGGPPPGASTGYAPQYADPNAPYQYAPPPGQYAPPPGPPQGQFASPGQYAPPPGPAQWNQAPAQFPTPTSQPAIATRPVYLGVDVPDPLEPAPAILTAHNPAAAVAAITKATKGWNTDEGLIISTLASKTALEIHAISMAFASQKGENLVSILESKTTGWFGKTLTGIALGPIYYDVDLVHSAISGVGTNETLLNEIILGRTRDELDLLIKAYKARHNRDLKTAVVDDLSGDAQRLFTIALTNAKSLENKPVDLNIIKGTVTLLHERGQKDSKIPDSSIGFAQILLNSSKTELAALVGEYNNQHSKKLDAVIEKKYSGHMESALLHVVRSVDEDGVWRDVALLEASMSGIGTKDALLVPRVVRAHWDTKRMVAIKNAYQKRYDKSLEKRISGETSGDYKKLLVALINNGA